MNYFSRGFWDTISGRNQQQANLVCAMSAWADAKKKERMQKNGGDWVNTGRWTKNWKPILRWGWSRS